MAKISPYESGVLTDSIFLILLTTLEPIHGYKIMQNVQEMTGGEVEIGPATMYTTLKKLCQAGWIAESREEESTETKILYRITGEGKEILYRNYENRKKIVELAKLSLERKNG